VPAEIPAIDLSQRVIYQRFFFVRRHSVCLWSKCLWKNILTWRHGNTKNRIRARL